MATAIKIVLYIFGVPIVVVFWIAVALIGSVIWDSHKKNYPRIGRPTNSLSTPIQMPSRKISKRNVKPTIIQLSCKPIRRKQR